MKIKILLGISLCICILCSCDPKNKDIIEPLQPTIEQPEEPNKPAESEEPQKPEEQAPIKEIININNKYMIIGTNDWYAITYGNEKYVTFNESGYLSTSTDGINWTTPKIPISGMKNKVGGLTFINDKFIGVTLINTNSYAIYSTDGENWVHNKIGNGNFNIIMYGNGIYVAVNLFGGVYTSIDGENWTINAKELSPQSTWNDGTFGNGKFVVINGETGNKHIATSTDGKNWSIKVVGTSYFKCIAFGDGKFIATNYYRKVFTSTDGENWTQLDDLPFEANDIIFVQ